MQFDFAPAAPSGYTPYPFQLDATGKLGQAMRDVRWVLVGLEGGQDD